MGVAGDQASSSHLMSVMGAWRSLPLLPGLPMFPVSPGQTGCVSHGGLYYSCPLSMSVSSGVPSLFRPFPTLLRWEDEFVYLLSVLRCGIYVQTTSHHNWMNCSLSSP